MHYNISVPLVVFNIPGSGRSSYELVGGGIVDKEKLNDLLLKVGDINDFSRPRPIVSLEEFFNGNNDPGSIWYNFPDAPEPQEIYKLLRSIKSRDDVFDVKIQISQHEMPDEWPSTDMILFVTTASNAEISALFPDEFKPDDVLEGDALVLPDNEKLVVLGGARIVGAWFD